MSRLTKEEILNFPKTTYGRALGKTIASKVMNELLQYKDLEEQLGCPLDVIIRAVKYGIYIKNIDGDMVNFKCYLYYKNPELGWYFIIVNNGYVPLTDYKVKFWLKEDKIE